MDTDMGTELDGRLLAMRQALAIAIALSTRSNPQATDMALELLGDLKAHMHEAPSDSLRGAGLGGRRPGRAGRHRPAGARLHADARARRGRRLGPFAPAPGAARARERPRWRPLRSMRVRGAAAIAVRAPDAPVQVAELGRHRLENLGRAGARFSSSAPQRLARSAGTQGLKRGSP